MACRQCVLDVTIKRCMGLSAVVVVSLWCGPGSVSGWSWCLVRMIMELGLSKKIIKNEKKAENAWRRGVLPAAAPAIT